MAEPLKCINLRICAFQTHNLLINHLLRRCQNASQLYINHDKIKKSSIFVSMTLKINLRISPAYTFKLRRYLHNFFTMRTNVLCESRRTANENREAKKILCAKDEKREGASSLLYNLAALRSPERESTKEIIIMIILLY